MNILYLSKLTANLFAGPNYSVPAQIKAQSAIENIFWYNLNNVNTEEWKKIGCKNIIDYPRQRLEDLPEPFKRPDIVIIEGLYCYAFSKIIREIQKKKIPYIIVPRSSMTEKAQNFKKLKKFFGNLIYFDSLIKNAAAIHYLSNEEKIESKKRWDKREIVIPNGIKVQNKIKHIFSKNEIRALYIGRYEQYQKGLDILINAINKIQNLLRENNFILNMYGFNQGRSVIEMTNLIDKFNINDLIRINDAVYEYEKEKKIVDSDIFIMSSRFEGMPMGLLEVLSYGIPVVITQGTNMREEIDLYDAGWTAANTVDSLVSALKSMVLEQNKYTIKGRNAKKLADKYSWDNIAQRSSREYQKILKSIR